MTGITFLPNHNNNNSNNMNSLTMKRSEKSDFIRTKSVRKSYYSQKGLKILMILGLLLFSISMFGQTRTIPAGSVIIDMGVSTQTIENGLKPYGLVYRLVDSVGIPVVWSINPAKISDSQKTYDQLDFTVDGIDFKGGPFIIEEQFANIPDIQSLLTQWQGYGVVMHTTLSEVDVPFYKEINIWPEWVIDPKNQDEVTYYLDIASIPDDAYRIANADDLLQCDDIYMMPHADPEWDDSGELYTWTQDYGTTSAETTLEGNRGWLWTGCHAASVLEQMEQNGDTTNFLSNPTMIGHKDHEDSSGDPFHYDHLGDSFMQFLGTMDGATENGSERIYLPDGEWRPTTQIAVWDPNQEDISSSDPEDRAAVVLYGPAFGNSDNGMVMYQGGHDLTKTGSVSEKVAAIRPFLNFSFDARTGKSAQFTDNSSVPLIETAGQTLSLNVSASSNIPGNNFTYQWTVSDPSAGSFTSPTSNVTDFDIDPNYSGSLFIKLTSTDDCGRESFKSFGLKIVPNTPFAPIANDDNYATYTSNSITFNPLQNDTDDNYNIDVTSLVPAPGEFLVIPGEGTYSINNTNGTITFTPVYGFVGTSTLDYVICDDTAGGPLCDTGTISIDVLDSPCSSNETLVLTTDYGDSVVSSSDWKDAADALGAPDSNLSKADKDDGEIIIDLGETAVEGSQIIFSVFSEKGKSVDATFDANSSNSFPNSQMTVTGITTEYPFSQAVFYTVPAGGARYVKVIADKEFQLESVTFEYATCIPEEPDSDLDGIPDNVDLDDDNDGILDKQENNLLLYGGFENVPVPNDGNNQAGQGVNATTILPWILTPGALGSGGTPNVVQVDGDGVAPDYNYGNGGPPSDADPNTGDGINQHYFDINGNADFYQTFTITNTTDITYSGYFSPRDNNNSATGQISIYSGTGNTGTLVSTTGTVAFPLQGGSSSTTPWEQISGNVVLTPGTYSFVVTMSNFSN
ncbi:MAG: hypothetical protein JSV73_02925, partial [Flavobacteriaceae bacterium]